VRPNASEMESTPALKAALPRLGESSNSLFHNILRASRLYARICEQQRPRKSVTYTKQISYPNRPEKNVGGDLVTVQVTVHPSRPLQDDQGNN